LKQNLRGRLVDYRSLFLGLSSGFPQRSLGRNRRQSLVPRDDFAGNAFSKPFDELACLDRCRTKRAVHIPRHADDDCFDLLFTSQLRDAGGGIAPRHIDGLERVRQQPEIVAEGHSHPSYAKIDAKNASTCHFQLKIPHHKPTLRNNMSSISYGKLGDNLPVTSLIALSQAAVGFGVGLLIAGKLDQTVRQRTAIAFIGAGAATILPLVAGAIADFNNRPDSSRRIRRQLASIREGTGLSNGDGAY